MLSDTPRHLMQAMKNFSVGKLTVVDSRTGNVVPTIFHQIFKFIPVLLEILKISIGIDIVNILV